MMGNAKMTFTKMTYTNIKKALKKRMALLLTVAMVVQTISPSYALDIPVPDSTNNVIDLMDNASPQAAFDSAVVEVGDTVNDDQSLTLKYYFSLNDAYLQGTYEDFINNGGLDYGEYLELSDTDPIKQEYVSYDLYLDAQSDLPDIGFTCVFDKGYMDISSQSLSADLEVKDAEGNTTFTIGDYTMTQDSEGYVTFSANIDKRVFYKQSVVAMAQVDAELESQYTPGTEVNASDGSGNVDVALEIPTNDDTATESDYSLEKSSQVDGTKITYTITAQASPSDASPSDASSSDASPSDGTDEDGVLLDGTVGDSITDDSESSDSELSDLRGTYITDKIPSGLDLDEDTLLSVRINDGELITLEDTDYTYIDGVLKYQITDDSSNARIYKAEFIFTTILDDYQWYQYAASGESKTWTFENKSSLLDTDENFLTISNKVTDEIKLDSLFEKSGEPLDASNKTFKWTIDVNGSFNSDSVDLYAIDHIENTNETHKYISGDNQVEIYEDDGTTLLETKDVVDLGLISDADADTYKYSNMSNVNTINEILTAYGVDISDDTARDKIYIYSYINETTGKTDQVMLIPLLDSYYLHNPIKVTYNTDASLGLEESTYDATEKTLTNAVKPVWQWTGEGEGPGGDITGGASVSKSYNVDYSLVSKTGGGYDETTSTITWNFEINQVGATQNITEFRLDDLVTDSKDTIKDENFSGDVLKIYKYDRSTNPATYLSEQDVPKYVEGSDQDSYYRLQSDSISGTTTFSIFFKTIEPDDYYRFSLMTQVQESNLAVDGTETRNNIAAYTATIGGNTVDKTVSADQQIKNTLITKIADPEGSYDYTDNTVSWTASINPNKYTLNDPTISDELPDGTSLKALTGATRNGVEATIDGLTADFGDGKTVSLVETTGEANADGYINNSVAFNFSETTTNASYTFTYSTQVEEAYRNEIFKSSEAITLTNLAGLHGTIGGSQIAATVSSADTIKVSAMIKTGEFIDTGDTGYTIHNSDGTTTVAKKTKYIHWKIYINRTGTNMSGAVITDQLNSFYELVPYSMKIWKTDIGSDGQELNLVDREASTPLYSVSGTEVPTVSFVALNYSGFTFTIPEMYKTDTLVFEFDTILVDNAEPSEMTNTISSTQEGREDSYTSGVASNAVKFRTSDYAYAEGVNFVKLTKVSSNLKTEGYVTIPGATFELQPMILLSGKDPTDINDWEEDSTQSAKTRVTNTKGTANYLFLKTDTMYKVKETVAPAGYQKTEDTYLVIKLNSKTRDDFPSEVSFSDSNSGYMHSYIKDDPLITTPSNGGTVEFTKLGQNSQKLSDVEFTISRTGFASHTTTSDADGIVKFEKLDPSAQDTNGTYKYDYRITETSTPYGYIADNNTYLASIRYDATNGYSYAIKVSGNMTYQGSDPSPQYELTNQEDTKSGHFLKVDQNGDPIGSGRVEVQFSVARKGDGGTYDADNRSAYTVNIANNGDPTIDNDYHEYKNKSVITNWLWGWMPLDDVVYGTYKLTEKIQSPIITYLTDPNVTPAVIYAKIDQDGVKYSTDSGTNKTWSSTGTITSITNELMYGYLDINKVSAEQVAGTLTPVKDAAENYKPIDGAEFELYTDKNSDGNYNSATDTLYITLKTDAEGHFTYQTAGTNKGKMQASDGSYKALLTGNYLLKEVSATDHIVDETYYPITISGTQKTSTTEYIPDTTWAVSGQTTATTDKLFLNEPQRGTINLSKRDYNFKQVLKGAIFNVYIKSGDIYKQVGKIADNSDGVYTLATPGDGTELYTNSLGESYIYNYGTEAEPSYNLLTGTYYLSEVTLPKDNNGDQDTYVQPDEYWESFVISNGTETQKKIINTLKTHEFSITKMVEKWSLNNPTSVSDFEKANQYQRQFTFSLSGYPANYQAASGYGPINKTTNSSGTVTFSGVPVGTYTVTETSIPTRYQFTDLNNLSADAITRMPDMSVVVTKDGVTITRPSTDTRIVKDTIVNNGSASDTKLTVYNYYKRGSITGSKVATANIKDSSTDSLIQAPLSDAKFTLLYDGNMGENSTGVTTTSGSLSVDLTQAAKINYNNVPFGNYNVKETTQATGYLNNTTTLYPVTVASESDAAVINPDNNGVEQAVINQAILKDIKFNKIDQNGDAIGTDRLTAKFIVVSRDSGSSLSSNIYSYPATVSNADDGVVTISGLGYGEYAVEESLTYDELMKIDSSHRAEFLQQGSADDYRKSVFNITVEAGTSSGTTKITLYNDIIIGSTSISDSDSDTDVYDFSTVGDNQYNVTNYLNYGFVSINKVRAEQVNAVGTVFNEVSDSGLNDVSFKIYEDTDQDGQPDITSPVMTLKTADVGGEAGHFNLPDSISGQYTDSVDSSIKHALLTGDYVVEEVIPNNMSSNYTAQYIKMHIDANKYTVLNTESNTAQADIYNTNNTSIKFYNIPKRGQINLTKTDNYNTDLKLDGAVFGVYDKNNDNKLVAFMVEDEQTTGNYILTKNQPTSYTGIEELTDNNAVGISYLTSRTGTLGDWILVGEYNVKELVAPEGYDITKVLPISQDVTVTEGQTTTIDVTNELIKHDIDVTKLVENEYVKGTYKSAEDTVSGDFTFTLIGTSSNAVAVNMSATVGTSGNNTLGHAYFESIPVGEYTITETGYPENYIPNTSRIDVTVKSDGIYYTGTDEKIESTNQIIFKDDLKRYEIYGRKITNFKDETSSPLEGAQFSIYTDEACTSEIPDTATVSDAEGNFKFTDIPYGTYYIKETQSIDGYTVNTNIYKVTVAQDKVMWNDSENEVINSESNPILVPNQAIEVALKLKKIDQNGDIISSDVIPLNFSITRTVGTTAMEKVLDKHASELSPTTVSNAADGTITISNLVYGTYRLTEQDDANITDGSSVGMTIIISKGESGKTRITVTNDGKDSKQLESTDKTVVGEVNDTLDFTADADCSIYNTVVSGFVQTVKILADVNADGTYTSRLDVYGDVIPLKGATFKVYVDSDRDGISDAEEIAADKEILTLVTGDDGKFTTADQGNKLIYGGKYFIKEISAPVGNYAISPVYYPFSMEGITTTDNTVWVGTTNKNDINIGYDSTSTGDIKVSPPTNEALNYVIPNGEAHRGMISLTKYDSEIEDTEGDLSLKLSGAEFDLYSKDTNAKVAKIIESDDTGTYKLAYGETEYVSRNTNGQYYLYNENNDGELTLLPGDYYIVETKAPAGYVLPDGTDTSNIWYFTIESNPEYARGRLLSSYSSSTINIGNRDLKDVYGDTKLFTNVINKVDVKIQKFIQDRNVLDTYKEASSSDAILKDATFVLTGIPANAMIYTDSIEIMGDVDSDGIVTFKDVPSGSYTVSETNVPDYFKTPASFKVTVDENGLRFDDMTEVTTDPRRVDNDWQRGQVHAVKYTTGRTSGVYHDNETVLSGAKFTLTAMEQEDNAAYGSTPWTVTSDKDGYIDFTDIPVGNYELKEISAPEGYIINSETREITVTTDSVTEVGSIVDQRVKGMVNITKVDEDANYLDGAIFTLYEKNGTKICDLTYSEDDMYTLPDPKDVTTVNATTVWKYMTYYDESNKTIPALYAGTYYIKETKAPDGYLRDTNSYKFTIDTDGETEIIANNGKLFTDTMAKGSIKLTKWAEVIEDSKVGTLETGTPAAGFNFKITGDSFEGLGIENYITTSDITGALSSSISIITSGDTAGIYVTTDETGSIILKNVPKGNYIIKELDSDKTLNDGYILDTDTEQVIVDSDRISNSISTTYDDGQTEAVFENYLKRSDIKGMKYKSGNLALAGATIGLFAEGTETYTTDTAYLGLTAISADDGSFTFTDIPYGEYIVAEISAPSGYKLNTKTTYAVNVDEDGVTIETGILTESGVTAESESAIAIVNTKKSSSSGGGTTTTPTVVPKTPGEGPGATVVTPTIPAGHTTAWSYESSVDPGNEWYGLDENGVPYGNLLLAGLPKTGETEKATQLLLLLTVLLLGAGIITLKRKKEDEL